MSDRNSTSSFSYDPVADVCYRTLDFMGFPSYRIGDDGSVWNNYYKTATPGVFGGGFYFRIRSWKKLTPKVCKKTNRHIVFLCRGTINGDVWVSSREPMKEFMVHKLVLTAFVGERPHRKEACHYPDTDPSNNALTNLRWDTRSANQKDAVKSGTNYWTRIPRHVAAGVLSEDRQSKGWRRRIALKYGIAKNSVSRIIERPDLDLYPVTVRFGKFSQKTDLTEVSNT